ncbi:MAG: leucyl aminopeptidase [Candidatus Marinimicrobia bacterium]|jgi:leucyl aminopeptidase|nr:leucyl aminopeptidase [Candidatus Neomarinimicrobiota bacterium]MBT3630897.1 leucyl aminopeptidase [Candidatus Neomarinimicrobiota bacterium]MBT3826169.1 leucyl aminopeptidase [Candidatus Neomarinimicrobiota bacterium]MBT4130885.1 leucyl aminopeptidase [Candidatus Neomarinimicrobiota bacterium]MBT4295678.1 leucyl aminopeptidase [Candidatus Neomarinimicrobiota bacterium]
MSLFNLSSVTNSELPKGQEAYVFGIFSDTGLTDEFKAAHPNLSKQINLALKNGEFKAKLNQSIVLYTADCETSKRFIAIGLGESGKYNSDLLRQASATAAKLAINLKVSTFAIEFMGENDLSSDDAQALAEGLVMGSYRFLNYKKSEDEYQGIEIVVVASDSDISDALTYGMHVAAGVVVARDLGNHPSNIATPTYLADTAEAVAKKGGMKTTIYDREDFEKMGFGGIAGVAQGSDVPPKFIVMKYMGGGKDSKTLGLVGKGLTFDSGGISIKPSAGMDEMKFDMLGGAAVLGIMSVVAETKPKLNIIAVVPATENMNGGEAYKPGDILTAYNGKTIEILNTDAEGRLILADGLAYITDKYELDGVVDFATLTGAVVVALGHRYSGIMTNDQDFADELIASGKKTQDRVWQMPMDDEYAEDIKSTIADVKNTGAGRTAGTIAAGAFLREFVKEGTSWCHVDIAGSGWLKKGRPYLPDGPTGAGVRLIMELIKSWE